MKVMGDIGNIAFWAHIAGFGAGAAVAWLMLLPGRLKSPEPVASEEVKIAPLLARLNALVRSGEGEEAGSQALAAFAKAKGEHDYGSLLQLYSWLLFNCELGSAAWLHKDAILPALRLKSYPLALHAIAKAAEGNALDKPEQTLLSFKSALEKSGESALAAQAGELLAKIEAES
jgi:hypothetical protein